MCSLAGGRDGTLESMRSKWRLEPEAEALGSDAATGESTVDGNAEGEGWKLEPGCIDDAFEGRSGVGCTNGEAGVGEEQDREHEGGAEEAPEHEVAALQHDDGELKQAADRHQAPGHTRAAPEAEAEP